VADIKLYGYSTSPYVRKVGCCLYYKQLPFEFVPVNPVDNSQIKFTGQTQVPVLQIDDEWRLDSTPLALWLDELFPELPLFGQSPEEREEILAVDKWISDSLILSGFKMVYETPMNARLRATAWRLANIVSSQTPLPDEIRNAWPQLLKTAQFIKHMVRCADTSESAREMRDRVGLELFQHFRGGPFFAGRAEPSLLDFAIFPQLVFGYMVGSEDELAIAKVPELREWIDRMTKLLPENPLLVPDFMIIHSLKQGVGEEFAA
jgi:glutathione S-transferase